MRVLMLTTVAAALLVALIGIVVLGGEVYRDLRLLQSASSDNMQWTLSQAEVEFLEFEKVLVEGRQADRPDLDAIRRKFDIFYSRIDTLTSGREYEGLAAMPSASDALVIVQEWLQETVAIIDADDAALVANLQVLNDSTDEIERALRTISVSGLSYFAAAAEVNRTSVAFTLQTLAIVTAIIICMLVLVALYFNRVSRQNIRRRREVQQTSARLEAVINTSLDAVVVTDRRGHILEFNAAAERIFGHRRETSLGKEIGSLIVPQHLRAGHAAGMERVAAGGARHVVGHGRVQLEGLRSTGEIFPIELSLQSANRDDEEIYVGFLRDISARVSNERDLVEARDRALAGEKAKANFLAVMSHEIRTPLNGLLGNLALLNATPLTPAQRDHTRRMAMSGRLLMNHVNDVLDIAKYEAGKLFILREPFDIDEMLDDLIDAQGGDDAAQGIVLSWKWVGPPLSWIQSDRTRIEQLLLNLLGNAIKFTQKGSVTIEAEIRSHNGEEAMIEFRVSDTGIGISDDNIERIFGDFETLDASFGRKVGGTGLGLGIARRICAAIGGEIGVQSVEGKGSTFWVRLPVTVAEPVPVPDIAPQTDTAHKRVGPARHILVVEDNEINLDVVRQMLQRDGHRVSDATNGEQAVDMAAATAFDLILMDISMPVMDGRQATQVIRAGGGASADRPIIAFTANVMPSAVDLFRQDGMDGTLSKPVTIEALRAVVEQFCHGRAAAMALATPEPEPIMLLDTARIEETRDLIGDGRFELFLGRLKQEMDDLSDMLRQTPLPAADKIADLCHRLASSAGTYGANQMREVLIAAENTARGPDGTALAEATGVVIDTWVRTRAALDAMLADLDDA